MNEGSEPNNSFLLNLVSEETPKKKVIRDVSKVDEGITEHASPAFQNEDFQFSDQEKNSPQISRVKFKNRKKGLPVKGSSFQLSKARKSKDAVARGNLPIASLFTNNPVVEPLHVKKHKTVPEPLFSTKTFEEIGLHPFLVSCLKNRLDIVKMTKVQEQTIPLLLAGKDALVKSCTGTGKTLAYAVPIVQKLQQVEPKIKRADGVYALIIVPTRELALQCFETFVTLTRVFNWIVPGYLIGGEKKKAEKARLRKGINILICTPGRLLDHLESTANLSLNNIAWLVIDEADMLLELKVETSIIKILSKCYENRQSTLLSATLSKEVENLAGISLSNPVRIDISTTSDNEVTEFQNFTVPPNLKQYVVVVPPKQRLIVLSSFIIENQKRGHFKGLIFMCSQGSVDFHHSLLNGVLAPYLIQKGLGCKFFKLHGHMKQEERTEIFKRFKATKEGVLFCTDVAAKGWDLPLVDWIIQYTAPHSVEIYVHRVGRTARIGKKGNSLLFLMPSEVKFTNLLEDHKINFEEISVNQCLQSLLTIQDILTLKEKSTAQDCATALQTRYEKIVYKEEELHNSAKAGFASCIQAYTSYPKNIRDIFPLKGIHFGHLAKSFCLREAPSNLRHPVSHIKQKFQPRKNADTKSPMKRKLPISFISEYDSGLSLAFKRKAKRKKR